MDDVAAGFSDQERADIARVAVLYGATFEEVAELYRMVMTHDISMRGHRDAVIAAPDYIPCGSVYNIGLGEEEPLPEMSVREERASRRTHPKSPRESARAARKGGW